MTDPWRDPTASGAVYADPTAPVFIAPIALPEPDPVFRDDALFASASANWRPAPVPPPPIPVLDESGELTLIPAPEPIPAPTPAMLRDEAVAALKAPPARYQAPASRGGARSTYTAEPQARPSRRPQPARPPGSVTTSPSTWLPTTGPTPTAPWRQQPAPPTWLPQPQSAPQRPQLQAPQLPPPPLRPGGPRPVPNRASGGTPGRTRPGGRRRSSKGWIPGLVVLAFVVLANVVPHLDSHRGVPAGVDNAVNSYYTDLELGDAPGAAQLICSAQRSDWSNGGQGSDLNLDPTTHTIASTSAAGGGKYTVDVNIVAPGRQNATLTVVKQDGAYLICGGTGP